jgi:tartrate dehydratase beta subunit/fumarate hydratase class I family protein
LGGHERSGWRLGHACIVDFPAFILVDDKGNDFFQQIG